MIDIPTSFARPLALEFLPNLPATQQHTLHLHPHPCLSEPASHPCGKSTQKVAQPQESQSIEPVFNRESRAWTCADLPPPPSPSEKAKLLQRPVLGGLLLSCYISFLGRKRADVRFVQPFHLLGISSGRHHALLLRNHPWEILRNRKRDPLGIISSSMSVSHHVKLASPQPILRDTISGHLIRNFMLHT